MTKKEALSILNPQHNTYEALRQAYRAACKKYHPDHGGDEEMMKVVNAAYDLLKGCKWSNAETDTAVDENGDIAGEIYEKWDKIKGWINVKGEICGIWLWLSGETWRYKKLLKEYGFRWSPNKRQWYWRPENAKKRTRKPFSMEDIRNTFGSTILKNEQVPLFG